MKRRIWVRCAAVAAAAALTLTACGESGSDSGESSGGDTIKIGLLGWFGGIAGPTHLLKKETYEAWASALNDAGGINGHKVEVVAVDHGGNQAQAATAARKLIDSDKVVALAVTGSVEGGAVAYAERKGVPVIGMTAGPPDQAKNPVMFKTGPDYDTSAKIVAGQIKAAGLTKVAALYCAEGAACKTNADNLASELKAIGVEVVYRASVSLSAPNYTAECIAARDAGAQAIYPVGNVTTPGLIAKSCAGQNYQVPMVMSTVTTKAAQDKNLEGSLAVVSSFPWFMTSGAPGIEEYAAVLKQKAPKLLGDDGGPDVSMAWLSAKAFQEAATTAFPEGAKVTPQALLEAVHKIKDNDVDGMMPGCMALTFTEGQTASPVTGGFTARIQNGTWVAPAQPTPFCIT